MTYVAHATMRLLLWRRGNSIACLYVRRFDDRESGMIQDEHMLVKELDVFTVRIERERLGKDADSIIKIFSIIEDLGMPVECVAKNIDWFSVTIEASHNQKVFTLMAKINAELSGVNIIVDRDMRILSIEDYTFHARCIAMILSTLDWQGIDIIMARQIKNHQKFVLGFRKDQFEAAKKMVLPIVAQKEW